MNYLTFSTICISFLTEKTWDFLIEKFRIIVFKKKKICFDCRKVFLGASLKLKLKNKCCLFLFRFYLNYKLRRNVFKFFKISFNNNLCFASFYSGCLSIWDRSFLLHIRNSALAKSWRGRPQLRGIFILVIFFLNYSIANYLFDNTFTTKILRNLFVDLVFGIIYLSFIVIFSNFISLSSKMVVKGFLLEIWTRSMYWN